MDTLENKSVDQADPTTHTEIVAPKMVTKKGNTKCVLLPVANLFPVASQQSTQETATFAFECKCGKAYKDRTGLWKHKKKCTLDLSKDIFSCICGKTYSSNDKLNNHYIDCNLFKNPIKENESVIEIPNSCLCGKVYKYRSGLWKHQKICNGSSGFKKDDSNMLQIFTELMKNKEENNNASELVLELLKQNCEFQKLIMEQTSKMMEMVKDSSQFNITNNNNSNNNTNNFNINMFLNEKCGNAMNIMDFVHSLPLQLDDLDNTAKLGYVNGISNIFLRGLNELDICERPIHCSDLKRETIYIKDNNVWEKDEDKGKVKKTIQYITQKNLKQLNDWVKENPESKDIKTKKHDDYMKILTKCTGGIDDEENEKFFGKIIKNVSKEVYIDKNDK